MTSPETHDFDALLGDLEAASNVPAKRRHISIKPTVQQVTSVLYNRGALPDELARLVSLIATRNELDQASLGAIVRSLYPSAKVGDEPVLRLVGALGHGQLKPALALQGLFLRWIVMVYHLLENPNILSRAYSVLFNLLDTAAIRPQLCHLLALITRRKHVTPFRIQAILGLSRQTGNDPPLTGLLRVFKNYYPEIIVGEVTKGRASNFKHPDPQWRIRLDEIQQRRIEHHDDGGPQNGFAVNHALGRLMKGAKALIIPAVHTQHAQENSVTLEEIDNPNAFVENLDKIELPTQLVAVMADPLLQKLLLLRPDADAFSRVSSWMLACLDDVSSGSADPSTLVDMVDVVHDYVLGTKSFPPLLLTFFDLFFKVWDGVDKREMILETVEFAPLMKFTEIYQSLFKPLETSILNNSADSQVYLLKFYTGLLRRWSIVLRSEDDLDSLPVGSVAELVVHVNKLALTLTQTSPTIPTYLAIVDFYECNAATFSQPKVLKHLAITIPPALVVYLLFFSNSIEVLSRLCSILATYKQSWEAVMTPSSPSSRPLLPREREHINTFNAFLMDICNCLWRNRAFATSDTDTNAQGCNLPASTKPAITKYLRSIDPGSNTLGLNSLFGLSNSPVLSLQAISSMRELEDAEIEQSQEELLARHAGPVTHGSLDRLRKNGGLKLSWEAYRSNVLRYLEAKGLPGIPELMYNTMKNLMKERNQ
ncbi:Mis6-domain-containing protein [Bombardia bombarda]|uniref:Mis6-domain-containing protein n=1 Tax=Bombardia bombarda TaxID=252184 RepID=A0AA39XLH8_9PEZI|nr:Mis6-domain-containing protein [Bombardia bombarda]